MKTNRNGPYHNAADQFLPVFVLFLFRRGIQGFYRAYPQGLAQSRSCLPQSSLIDRGVVLMRIAVVAYEGMTLLDMVGPIQTWSFLPDTQIQVIAKTAGPVATDCGVVIHATHDLASAWPDPEVLFIGGAAKPAFEIAQDTAVTTYLANAGSQAKWITSVCTGSLILGAAGLLKGYRAATHWAAREQMASFGAILSDERVCIDRNRLTGGGITSGIDFGITLAGLWAGEETARTIELMMEYAPQPPYGTGRPDLADPATLARAQAIVAAAF
jgi:cyclohexyl-isocyanide hydratase